MGMIRSGSSDDSIAQKTEAWPPVADLTGNAIAVLERRYLKKN
jgi:hypothetical protein